MRDYITTEGLGRLKKELEYLENIKRKEIAQKLKEEATLGDLSENAQYHELKQEQAFLEGRILKLREIINGAIVIEEEGKKNDRAGAGSLVTIVFDGKTEKFRIVGSSEADPLNGKISWQSPLGKMLLGKKKGASFEFEGPGGKIKCHILEIE